MENLEQLENQAVDAAINFNWNSAIELNQKIIKLDKKNLAAFLRLGFAYTQKQSFTEASKHYRKVLKIQPNNNIALENIERINVLKTRVSKKKKTQAVYLDPNLFLESPGKTKSVSLVNLGQKNILANLYVRQELFLRFKTRKVELRTRDKE